MALWSQHEAVALLFTRGCGRRTQEGLGEPEGPWLGSEGKASRGNAAISWSRLPGSVPTGVSPRLVPIWRPLLGSGLETSTPELQQCLTGPHQSSTSMPSKGVKSGL